MGDVENAKFGMRMTQPPAVSGSSYSLGQPLLEGDEAAREDALRLLTESLHAFLGAKNTSANFDRYQSGDQRGYILLEDIITSCNFQF